MRPQDIVIGENYRFKRNPDYAYAKALEVIKAKTGVNTNSYAVIRCEHRVYMNDKCFFIRHFRPCDLVKQR